MICFFRNMRVQQTDRLMKLKTMLLLKVRNNDLETRNQHLWPGCRITGHYHQSPQVLLWMAVKIPWTSKRQITIVKQGLKWFLIKKTYQNQITCKDSKLTRASYPRHLLIWLKLMRMQVHHLYVHALSNFLLVKNGWFDISSSIVFFLEILLHI